MGVIGLNYVADTYFVYPLVVTNYVGTKMPVLNSLTAKQFER